MSATVSTESARLDSNESLSKDSERKGRPEKVVRLVLKNDAVEASRDEYSELRLVLITDGYCRGKLIGELSEKDLMGVYYSGCLRRAETRGKKDCFVQLKRFVEHFYTVYRESNRPPDMVDLPSELIPSGKHNGKRLCEIPDYVLMAMQGSWADSPRLRSSAFFEKIQDEVRRRNLHVLELSSADQIRAKAAKCSRSIIEAELRKLCGGSISQEKRVQLQTLLSGI